MTELEKLQKTNLLLKDTIEAVRYKASELKQDVKELQDEIKLIAAHRACPALIEARETIKTLKKQLENHEEYERNTLIGDSDNAAN